MQEGWNKFMMKRYLKKLSGLLIDSAVFMMQTCSKQVWDMDGKVQRNWLGVKTS